MYYYVYRITNKIDGKFYIGVHKTTNLNDGYMGSGVILKRAISTYGQQNFHKEILEFFDSYEDALEREFQLVDEEFLLREDTYNIRRGGTGGFDYINKNGLNYLSNNKLFADQNYFYGKKHSDETKRKIANKTSYYKKGISLTEAHKNQISESLTGKEFTQERKDNISKSKQGKPAHNKGVPAEKWKCPHCGKEGGGTSNKLRWHFDNCKENRNES